MSTESSMADNMIYVGSQNLFDSDKTSDIIVKFGANAIKAHKATLAQNSEYFERKFQDEPKCTELVLEDVDPNAALGMLAYLYGLVHDGKGGCYRSSSAVSGVTVFRKGASKRPETKYFVDLYIAAEKYEIKSLKDEISDGIEEELSSQKPGVIYAVARYIYEKDEAELLHMHVAGAIANSLKDGTSLLRFGPLLRAEPNLPIAVLEVISKRFFNARSVFWPE